MDFSCILEWVWPPLSSSSFCFFVFGNRWKSWMMIWLLESSFWLYLWSHFFWFWSNFWDLENQCWIPLFALVFIYLPMKIWEAGSHLNWWSLFLAFWAMWSSWFPFPSNEDKMKFLMLNINHRYKDTICPKAWKVWFGIWSLLLTCWQELWSLDDWTSK